jgi:hydrogenase nickel incorporation protein HypA/HybF
LELAAIIGVLNYREWDLHELSVCQAMLTQVIEIAANRGADAVERIVIEVGPLSGVEPRLLARAFDVLRAGSCAADAVLSIESPGVTICCMECGAQSQTAPNRLVCAGCGGYRSRIVTGDELQLRRVELRVPQPASAA